MKLEPAEGQGGKYGPILGVTLAKKVQKQRGKQWVRLYQSYMTLPVQGTSDGE